MQNLPLISVIVPIYNVAPWLPRCLDSIVGQTYKNLEIILIDDGSTDNSLEICQTYGAKDTRIKIIHQENKGVSAARNAGLDAATGEFIAFCDPDDWLSINAYETLFDLYQQSGADICWGNVAYCYADAHPVPEQKLISPKDALRIELDELLLTHFLHVWTELYTRRLIAKGLRFDTSYSCGEDLDFIFQAAKRANFIASTEKTVYFYQVRMDSVSHAPNLLRCIQSSAIYKKIYQESLLLGLPLSLKKIQREFINSQCILFVALLLYDKNNVYLKLCQQLTHALRKNLREILFNPQMSLAGKMFLMISLLFPRITRYLFQQPYFYKKLCSEFQKRFCQHPTRKIYDE